MNLRSCWTNMHCKNVTMVWFLKYFSTILHSQFNYHILLVISFNIKIKGMKSPTRWCYREFIHNGKNDIYVFLYFYKKREKWQMFKLNFLWIGNETNSTLKLLDSFFNGLFPFTYLMCKISLLIDILIAISHCFTEQNIPIGNLLLFIIMKKK